MFNPFEAPCMRYIGDVSNENIEGCTEGRLLPLFELVEPEDRPSINTLEGWNKLADERNRRSFISATGRKPQNDAELNAWVNCMCREAGAAV